MHTEYLIHDIVLLYLYGMYSGPVDYCPSLDQLGLRLKRTVPWPSVVGGHQDHAMPPCGMTTHAIDWVCTCILSLVKGYYSVSYHFARPEKSKNPGLLVLQGPTVTCRRTCSLFTNFSPLMLPRYLLVVSVQ